MTRPHFHFPHDLCFVVRAVRQSLSSARLTRSISMPLLVTIALTLCASSAPAGISFRTVALRSDTAPGAGGAIFLSLSGPSINNVGQTVFSGNLALTGDVTSADNGGVWSEGTGSLGIVAREGSPAPGTGGVNFSAFGTPVMNDFGRTAFSGSLQIGGSVTSSNNTGVWTEGSGSLGLLARAGALAPGTGGKNFLSMSVDPAVNNAGQTAFSANARDASSNTTSGIWSGTPGGLDFVVGTGSVAPGTGGATFQGGFLQSSSRPSLNLAGATAFRGTITGAGVTSANDQGIWLGNSVNLSLLAREGSPAPGLPGSNFRGFSTFWPDINGGQAAFRAAAINGSSTITSGIWSGGVGSLGLVAATGEIAPGTGGGTFSNFIGDPVINASGQAAFFGSARPDPSTIRSGIWSQGSGSLALVALLEGPVPGVPGGTFDFLSNPTINAAGKVAFKGSSVGTGAGTFIPGALFAEGPAGLQLVAGPGVTTIEVRPGDFRTISTIGFLPVSGNQDGRPSGFNDLGELVFAANFTDGTNGIIVASTGADGSAQAAPILPLGGGLNSNGDFAFNNLPGDGRWFDPIAALGFVYETDGLSNFTDIELPSGLGDTDGLYTVFDLLNGTTVVAAGGSHIFPTAVSKFFVTGIDPPVDGEDPLAFPTFLAFDQTTVSFTMTPIPEPSSFLLAAGGLAMLAAFSRRRGTGSS